MKYQRVQEVPSFMLSYSNMNLFASVPDDEKSFVWESLLEYFEAARQRESVERPDPPAFKSKTSERCYKSMIHAMEEDCEKYWKKCGLNADRRNIVKEENDGLTAGRPLVDRGSTNTIQSNTNQSKADNTIPPPQTPQEVQAYCRQANIGLASEEATRFFITFSRTDWKDRNGKPIKDWHMLAASWAKEQHSVSAQNYEQRNYTEDELLSVSDDLLEEARRMRVKN